MKQISSIKIFLSRKIITWLVLLISIGAKSVLIFFYTFTGRDKIYHLSAGYNLLHAKGWTNSFYYLDNLNKEVLEPFCFWPPGYGLMMVPFQVVFGRNFYLSTAIFEMLCFIAFIFLCRAILKTQKLEPGWTNLSTIILAFSPHIFIQNSLGTDLVGLCFLLGFFYYTIKLWNAGSKNPGVLFGFLAGVCMFLAAFIRFLYIPVCIFTSVVFLAVILFKRQNIALPGIIACLVTGGICISVAMYIQGMLCGSPVHLGPEQTKGVFFDNLKFWYPAAIEPFFNTPVMSAQLGKFASWSYDQSMAFFSWFNLCVYAALLVISIRYLKKVINEINFEFPAFHFLGFIICLAVIGGLGFLSLTTAPQIFVGGGKWTFITEGRYYAFVIVFIQLLFLVTVPIILKLPYKLKAIPAITFFLFGLMLLNSLHELYFTTKVALNFSRMKSEVVREQDYVYFESFLKNTVSQNPDKEILVAASDKYFPLLASIYGAKGIGDESQLNNLIPKVSSPSILIAIISSNEKDRFAGYLQRKGPEVVAQIADKTFYVENLRP